MKLDVKYKRIDDDKVIQLINGKPVAMFKLKGWLNNLMSYPDKTKGGGSSSRGRRINRFNASQYEYNGKWE